MPHSCEICGGLTADTPCQACVKTELVKIPSVKSRIKVGTIVFDVDSAVKAKMIVDAIHNIGRAAWLRGFEAAKPLSPEQAQKEFDEAEPASISETEIQRCIDFVGEKAAQTIRLAVFNEAIVAAEDWLRDGTRTCSIASVLRELRNASN